MIFSGRIGSSNEKGRETKGNVQRAAMLREATVTEPTF